MSAEANHPRTPAKPQPGARRGRLPKGISAPLRFALGYRSMRYGLRRDLSVPLEKPTAKIPISVRPMVNSDLPLLLSTDHVKDDPQEKQEIAWRRDFIAQGAQTCFVAVDERDDRPCYMQWLIGSADNDFVRRLEGFPELKPDEALLENAYTPVAYRGLGIMSAAMSLIAERAADLGARSVLTFVLQDNIASLKGCQRAGFFPHMLHHKLQLGFGLLKRHRFEILADADRRRSLRF